MPATVFETTAESTSRPALHPERDLLVERCAFLGITEADCRRVRALRPCAEEHVDWFVERFYEHLLSFASTRYFLRDPGLVEHLKGTQKNYLLSLFDAQLDAEYAMDRRRVGKAHADVGLDPEWFLGAYNLYLQDWFRFLAVQFEGRLDEYIETTGSLVKLTMLDIGLALDAYFARSTEQIRSALAMYAQTNTELQEFASLASHDLKTPLATVAALCEEFLDEFGHELPQAGIQLIDAARQRTLKMGTMLDDLLTASTTAAEPGRQVTVSPGVLIEEAIEPLRSLLAAQQVAVHVIEPLPIVSVNPTRLRCVFHNLVSNAAKFVERMPSRVRVWAESREREVVFCVEDEGPGIGPNDLRAIFAPFHRLPQHRHLPGTGLGLYFVRRMVEEQGGRAWVESTPGIGSKFFVALPRPKSAIPARRP
jgi:signal transduction histidine kinase